MLWGKKSVSARQSFLFFFCFFFSFSNESLHTIKSRKCIKEELPLCLLWPQGRYAINHTMVLSVYGTVQMRKNGYYMYLRTTLCNAREPGQRTYSYSSINTAQIISVIELNHPFQMKSLSDCCEFFTWAVNSCVARLGITEMIDTPGQILLHHLGCTGK